MCFLHVHCMGLESRGRKIQKNEFRNYTFKYTTIQYTFSYTDTTVHCPLMALECELKPTKTYLRYTNVSVYLKKQKTVSSSLTFSVAPDPLPQM